MRLLKFLLALSIVGFTCSIALADTGGAPVDPYALYYPLIATGLGTLGALVRSKTPSDGFWHTWYGHALLTLIGAVAGSLTPLFETGHVTMTAIVSALVGGGVTFLSAYKTTGKQPSTSVAGFLIPFLFIFTLPSCAHSTPEQKAFGAAFGACMEAKGIAVAPGVGQTVYGDLNNGTNEAAIVAQLEALAKQAGNDAVMCATQAWLTTPVRAEKNPAGVAAAKTFLGKKTTRRAGEHAALDPPQGDGPWPGASGATASNTHG